MSRQAKYKHTHTHAHTPNHANTSTYINGTLSFKLAPSHMGVFDLIEGINYNFNGMHFHTGGIAGNQMWPQFQ